MLSPVRPLPARRSLAATALAALVPALVPALVLAGTVVAAGPAVPARAGTAQTRTTQPAQQFGNDVSWPQCTKAQGGYGLPMPAASARFVVIGLTKGLPFTVNPCLADQVAWAAQRRLPAQAYTIPAFPTAAQLTAYGSQGPWAATTRLGRLANVGYSQGTYTLGRLGPARFTPTMIWVDVEARGKQPWPTGSAFREAENRAVILGMLRRFDDAGIAYGYYSNASGWRTITGSWWAPGTPAWVTVGRKTAAEAVAACARRSFSAGPPHLAQWFDDTRDDDVTCAAHAAAPPVPYPASGPNDLDGDWSADLVAREASTGLLWRYPRPAAGPAAASDRVRIGNGWASMDLVDTAGDLNGDGVPDLVAREAATGRLWLYPRSAAGGWLPARPIGPGWDVMSAIVAAEDLGGDHVPDVLARDRETGRLWLYAGDGKGGLAAGVPVGHGWTGFDVILGPGDVDGDGNADVLARKAADGSLWLYPGNGAGGWRSATRIGTGWGMFDLIAAPGDVTGDAAPDVVARERGTGRLWVYPTTGAGHWRPRIDRGTGWEGLDALM